MSLLSKLRARLSPNVDRLAAHKKNGVLLYALKVGSLPSQADIEKMLRACDHPEFRRKDFKANLTTMTVEDAHQLGVQYAGEAASRWRYDHLAILGCVAEMTRSLKEAKQFPSGTSLTPRPLWASGKGNMKENGEIFLIGASLGRL
jgi:hypothetical protein